MKHGGDLGEARSRYGEAAWLDLSTGINPHPWPVPPELACAGWERLPGRAETDALLEAARGAYGVPDRSGIVATPGTQAAMQWLPRLAPPGLVQVLGPTYGGHAEAWRTAGFQVEVTTGDHVLPDARHIVVVNPNNPDGRVRPPAEILRLAALCAVRGGWLVVDEAFADAEPAAGIVPRSAGMPVVVLRSFGKFYGLPGIRLGFAIASEPVTAALGRALGDWAVSVPALLVGARALADHAWADAMRVRLAEESGELGRLLAAGGLRPAGGTSLFRLVRHPEARAIHDRLAQRGIWTRCFDWADDLLRIGLPGGTAASARLADALELRGTAAR